MSTPQPTKIVNMTSASDHGFVEQFHNGEDLVNLYRFPNGYGAEVTVALIAGGLGMDSFKMRVTRYSSPSDPTMVFEYLPGVWELSGMPPFTEFVTELDRIAGLNP